MIASDRSKLTAWIIASNTFWAVIWGFMFVESLPRYSDYASLVHLAILLSGIAAEWARNRLAPIINCGYYLAYGGWWALQILADLWRPSGEPEHLALIAGVIGVPMIIEGIVNCVLYSRFAQSRSREAMS